MSDDPTDQPRCGRLSKSTGKPCRRYPTHGATCCVKHGAGAPQVKAAAAARLAAAQAVADMTKAAVTYGARRDIDPAAALLELVAVSAGHVAWLAQRVAETDAKALVAGVAEQRIGADGEKTVIVRSQPNVWLTLYNGERAFLAKVCADTLRAGVEDRAVRLAERQGELLTVVIAALIADDTLGLTEGQRAAAVAAVPKHLRAVADAETAGLGWSGSKGDGRSGDTASG